MICNLECVQCLIRRQARRAAELDEPAVQLEYMAEAMHVIADNAGRYPAPVIVNRLSKVEKRFFGDNDLYADVKAKYNEMLLGMEADIRARIDASDDPVHTALLFARAGNYIDFGAMHSVDDDMLSRVLNGAVGEPLEESLYRKLRDELAHAEKVVYLTDNCGEIVIDKLLAECIGKEYPDADITVIVKGGPTLNDATMDDAVAVGMDKAARVITSGADIPGMWLDEISDSARETVLSADVIIAKGQANVETLRGSGLNIYYLLLCKCERFRELFGMEQLGGIFTNELILTRDEVNK